MSERIMAFSGAGLDHCETERTGDQIRTAIREPSARVILFHNYQPAVEADGTLLAVHPSELAERALFDPAIAFLGREEESRRPWFAAHIQDPDNLLRADQFADLRRIASHMSAKDLALVGRGRSLLEWHGTHGFCAQCGERSMPAKGAAVRVCKACQTEHYPRVSPVAIMLVVHEDHLLLGRQAFWPDGSFSALAGFVSPGENLEEACAREVLEEVGVRVSNVRYLMSQVWPFPSQLMLGLIADAESRELTIDETELETAQWFSRAEVEAVFAKTGEAFLRPPAFTIAHQLMRAWLEL